MIPRATTVLLPANARFDWRRVVAVWEERHLEREHVPDDSKSGTWCKDCGCFYEGPQSRQWTGGRGCTARITYALLDNGAEIAINLRFADACERWQPTTEPAKQP